MTYITQAKMQKQTLKAPQVWEVKTMKNNEVLSASGKHTQSSVYECNHSQNKLFYFKLISVKHIMKYNQNIKMSSDNPTTHMHLRLRHVWF
jgi:hypothetical protein